MFLIYILHLHQHLKHIKNKCNLNRLCTVSYNNARDIEQSEMDVTVSKTL